MGSSPRVLCLRVLAIALALFTARLIATDLATLHGRAKSLGNLSPVLVANRDLSLGTVLKSSDFAIVERHSSQTPGSTLHSIGDAVGKTVVVPVVESAYLLDSNVAESSRRGTAELIAADHVAVRVVSEDGLSPTVGSSVQVIATLDGGAPASTAVLSEVALVLGVDGGDNGRELGVLLEVPRDDAPRIAFALANGVVMLALLPPEDVCCAESRSSSQLSSVADS